MEEVDKLRARSIYEHRDCSDECLRRGNTCFAYSRFQFRLNRGLCWRDKWVPCAGRVTLSHVPQQSTHVKMDELLHALRNGSNTTLSTQYAMFERNWNRLYAKQVLPRRRHSSEQSLCSYILLARSLSTSSMAFSLSAVHVNLHNIIIKL